MRRCSCGRTAVVISAGLGIIALVLDSLSLRQALNLVSTVAGVQTTTALFAAETLLENVGKVSQKEADPTGMYSDTSTIVNGGTAAQRENTLDASPHVAVSAQVPLSATPKVLDGTERPREKILDVPQLATDPMWMQMLALMGSRRDVCEEAGVVQDYTVPKHEKCWETPHLATMRNMRYTYDNTLRVMTMAVDCTPIKDTSRALTYSAEPDTGPLSKNIGSYETGFSAVKQVGGASTMPCSFLVEEPTILHVNPRKEAWGSPYHVFEELFGTLQSVVALGADMSDFRLLEIWVATPTRGPLATTPYEEQAIRDSSGSMRLLQLESQLRASDSDSFVSDETAPRGFVIPQLVDLYSRLFAGGQNFTRLPETIPRTSSLCFRQVVLPMRACSGSFITRGWDARDQEWCRFQPFIAHASLGMLRKLGLGVPRQAGPKQVMIQIRGRGSAKNGRWSKLEDVEVLKGTLSKVAKVEAKDFGQMSIMEQIGAIHSSDVVIGPHGAALTQVIFMRKGSSVVEATSNAPPTSYSTANIFYVLCIWVGLHYRSLEASEQGEYFVYDVHSAAALIEDMLKGGNS